MGTVAHWIAAYTPLEGCPLSAACTDRLTQNLQDTRMISVNTKEAYPMNAITLRSTFDRRAKAGAHKEERKAMTAAQDQLGQITQTVTANYVWHRKGKLEKPTK
jgi:thymidylate synthase ThyX